MLNMFPTSPIAVSFLLRSNKIFFQKEPLRLTYFKAKLRKIEQTSEPSKKTVYCGQQRKKRDKIGTDI